MKRRELLLAVLAAADGRPFHPAGDGADKRKRGREPRGAHPLPAKFPATGVGVGLIRCRSHDQSSPAHADARGSPPKAAIAKSVEAAYKFQLKENESCGERPFMAVLKFMAEYDVWGMLGLLVSR
jgi:hypothetical protein